jgi:hypothetical protein
VSLFPSSVRQLRVGANSRWGASCGGHGCEADHGAVRARAGRQGHAGGRRASAERRAPRGGVRRHAKAKSGKEPYAGGKNARQIEESTGCRRQWEKKE